MKRERTIDGVKSILAESIRDEDRFLRLTISGAQKGNRLSWSKISVRPVLIRSGRKIQFSYFDGNKEIAQNYSEEEAVENLAHLLSAGYSNIHVQATDGDLHVRITRKGRVLISRGKPSRREEKPILRHNRTKSYPLPLNEPDEFLIRLGIMNDKGDVRRSRMGKFRQINEFLRVIESVVPLLSDGKAMIIDCGCGRAYLSFAVHHYLRRVHGFDVNLIGVDHNAQVIAEAAKLRDMLGWSGLDFVVSSIAEYRPTALPDIVLSLHACDTATDEAIARGITWGSRIILAAPCCQHELHGRIDPPDLKPLIRHGILRERLADIVTDALRSLVLEIMGYRTDVFQFIDPEHTAKNIMIKGVKTRQEANPRAALEYMRLKEYLGLSSISLEDMLGDHLRNRLVRG